MAFDQIDFQVSNSQLEDYKVVDIYINAFRLIDLVRSIEHPYALLENNEGLAGAYEGIPAIYALPPAQHFLGQPVMDYRYPDSKTAILEYAHSGIPGDWTLTARIGIAHKTVRWSRFEQIKRSQTSGQSWDYQDLGAFVFEKDQYMEALTEAATDAYE